MGADKGDTKSGGFFHLFDWNRKSRKKLFSISPEGTKQVKRCVDNLATTRLRLADDHEFVAVSSGKGSSDYSCASSVTDEEGIAVKAPGVVARLMGLDHMPTSVATEPSFTPLFDSRSLRDKHSHKYTPDQDSINDKFSHIMQRSDNYAGRAMELRAQKMPSSPIERFQTETFPSRQAKSPSMAHHKLFSPIKNHGFSSDRSATHIMEAAVKILDPGNQMSTRAKLSSFGSSSIPLRVCDSKENLVLSQSQRTSRILESVRAPVDSSDFRYLRGQPLNRGSNGSEDTVSRQSSTSSEPSRAVVRSKGKSVSLAVQAKVNVQRREGLSSSSRSSALLKEHDHCSFNQPCKSHPSNQKNKLQKKPSATNASCVLRQNNQKQNCTSSKGKLSVKQPNSNQHGRKILTGNASAAKNKLSGNSNVGFRKECTTPIDFEREDSSSSYKDFPQKKRLIERGFVSEKCGSMDNVLVDRHQKQVQSIVSVAEHSHSRWKKDNKSEGPDVVSFIFTSPLIKPTTGSRFSTKVAENFNHGSKFCFDSDNQKKDDNVNAKTVSSLGLNVTSGDALSLLLEQKLRELTCKAEPPYDSILKAGCLTSSSPISQEPVSRLDTSDSAAVAHGKDIYKSGSVFGYGISSINGQVSREKKLQGAEECSSWSDARKEYDHEHSSPFSILDATFSNESYSYRTDGSKTCSSSIQAQNNISFNSLNKSLFPEADIELSDSASSTLTETSDASELSKASCRVSNQDLEYVKDVLHNMESASTDSGLHPLVLAGDKLNLNLFDKLEGKRRVEGEDSMLRRKVLFDCVDECVDLKCGRYFRTGYRAWSNGAVIVGKESLAKEIYDEIFGWERMKDWTVDELVDKDMSSHVGRWVDYEIEAFEAGLEIERAIVNSLVDEVIADCLRKSSCRQAVVF